MAITRKPVVQKIPPIGEYWKLRDYAFLFESLLYKGLTVDQAAEQGRVSRSMIHQRLRALHKLVVLYIKYHYPHNSQKILSLMEQIK